jgi:hypothetical protein
VPMLSMEVRTQAVMPNRMSKSAHRDSRVGKIEIKIKINQRNRWPSITPRLVLLVHPAKTTTMTEPQVVRRIFEIG